MLCSQGLAQLVKEKSLAIILLLITKTAPSYVYTVRMWTSQHLSYMYTVRMWMSQHLSNMYATCMWTCQHVVHVCLWTSQHLSYTNAICMGAFPYNNKRLYSTEPSNICRKPHNTILMEEVSYILILLQIKLKTTETVCRGCSDQGVTCSSNCTGGIFTGSKNKSIFTEFLSSFLL